ncbi:Multimodular transpeptidase-transglycosylase [hydrothermal vent metagenome]|uniref:Penicillin-binding protein 1A n=1 Tax=hydrothermal vent metagenome TaxID=652676 RepID=A0A3B1C081_9ZZZZ
MLLAAIGGIGTYIYIVPRLPDISNLKDVQMQVPLRVYARGGELIAEFGEMKRIPFKYEEFPKSLIHAVLAAEDDRFFQHPGVDYQGILRAVWQLVRTGERTQGGSTITMQVARNFFLSREKTFLRKINEIFLALKIEHELTKEEILTLYLNKIYLGKRAYGFAAAAQVYYGKPLAQLRLPEIAMIAGLPKAPSRYNPVVAPERARIRRDYVLGRMLALGYINKADYIRSKQVQVHAGVHGLNIGVEAPYVAEMVRNEMLSRYGEAAYTHGFEVYTTIDARLQKAANQALRDDLLAYDRRHGYRGIIKHVDLLGLDAEAGDLAAWAAVLKPLKSVGHLQPALIISVGDDAAYAFTRDGTMAYLGWKQIEWARRRIDENHLGPKLQHASEVLKAGDVVYVVAAKTGCHWLAEVPKVAGALVSLRPRDGATEVLVGGFDYYQSKFNRVVQAQRQPGSSFKPFVYTAALDKGYTAASIINDAPVVFDAPGLEDTWRPENYSGRFFGPTRLRVALIKSRNLVSIRLLRRIGIGYTVRYVSRFGFKPKNLPRNLSLALGSGAVAPYQLATAYAVFANGGYKVNPYFIDYIRMDDHIVYMTKPRQVCQTCEVAVETQAKADRPAAPKSVSKTNEAAVKTKESSDSVPWILPAQYAGLDEREWAQIRQGPELPHLAKRVLSPQTAFLINTMLRDVIRKGTGRRALVLKRKDLGGKTGTTNDQRDAWFTGFNADVATIAWVGFDTPQPLGAHETGARAALPMWISYMRAALQGRPETPLEQPQGIVSVRIDPETGELADANQADAIFEYFRSENVPKRQTDESTGNSATQPGSDITEQLF